MGTIARIIGWVILILFVIGHVVPGQNFHLFAGDDESALKYHQASVERIQKRIINKKHK